MKALILLSGGLDSTALTHHLLRQGHEVQALSFDYGQRHGRCELRAAADVAAHFKIQHTVVDLRSLTSLIAGQSALLNPVVDVPEGHYADETMKQTVVPNRNMIMLSVAGGIAIARKLDAVAYAAHASDHTIYPDCRPEFADLVGQALSIADWHPITLLRPFVSLTKAEVVKAGEGAPFHLTYSCYKGLSLHCGRCGTCVERKEAFQLAGVQDPTEYV